MRLIAVTVLTLTASVCQADLVTSSSSGNVYAQFALDVDTNSSTAPSAGIQALASGNNSFTQTALTYAFDLPNLTLTGNSLITAQKTVSARPGGDHTGTSQYLFNFEIDAPMKFDLDGTWGFAGSSGSGTDTLLYALTGPGGSVASGSTTSNLGVNSDTFSESLTLQAGSYALTFTAELRETINNQDTRLAGWTIDGMTLAPGCSPRAWEPGFGRTVFGCRSFHPQTSPAFGSRFADRSGSGGRLIYFPAWSEIPSSSGSVTLLPGNSGIGS